MSDLIDRQAAIDALRVAYWDDNIQSTKDDPCIVDAMTDWAIRQVKALPPAQPKRGKWIKYEQEFMLEESLGTVQKTVRECSVCTAKIAGMVGIMNFCPNCGAKMEGVTT